MDPARGLEISEDGELESDGRGSPLDLTRPKVDLSESYFVEEPSRWRDAGWHERLAGIGVIVVVWCAGAIAVLAVGSGHHGRGRSVTVAIAVVLGLVAVHVGRLLAMRLARRRHAARRAATRPTPVVS